MVATRDSTGVPKDQLTAGDFCTPHGACWDKAGNIYVTEWLPYKGLVLSRCTFCAAFLRAFCALRFAMSFFLAIHHSHIPPHLKNWVVGFNAQLR